jgi:hypothetical protein
MGTKIKNKIIANPNHLISVSEKTVKQQASKNPGVIKRFLNWVARGAEKSRMSSNSCPT